MEVLSKMTDLDGADYSKELPFYNKRIEKPEIKRLKTLICFLNFLFIKN